MSVARFDCQRCECDCSILSDLQSFLAFLQAVSVIADGAEEGTRADIYREEVRGCVVDVVAEQLPAV